jgi:hypothetical protein
VSRGQARLTVRLVRGLSPGPQWAGLFRPTRDGFGSLDREGIPPAGRAKQPSRRRVFLCRQAVSCFCSALTLINDLDSRLVIAGKAHSPEQFAGKAEHIAGLFRPTRGGFGSLSGEGIPPAGRRDGLGSVYRESIPAVGLAHSIAKACPRWA